MRPHLGKMRPIWAICTKSGQKRSRIGGKKFNHLIQQCEFDREKGATMSGTAAARPWGTAFGAAAYICVSSSLLAFVVIKQYGSWMQWKEERFEPLQLMPSCSADSSRENTEIYSLRRTPSGIWLSLATYWIMYKKKKKGGDCVRCESCGPQTSHGSCQLG